MGLRNGLNAHEMSRLRTMVIGGCSLTEAQSAFTSVTPECIKGFVEFYTEEALGDMTEPPKAEAPKK